MAEDDRNDDAPETLPSPMAPGAPLEARRRDSDTSCLSEDEVLAYVEGRTTSRLRDQVDRHIDRCQDCWLLVEALLGDARVPSAELPAPFRITTFSVGNLIAERYRIEQFIGKGGMGEVYRAHDSLMLKVVALKTPLCSSCDDASALRKFFDEARNADRITHENICRIYALQEHRDPSGDRPPVPFFTMEYIEGMSLAARVKQGPLPLPAVRSIARQLLRGLRAAHHQRVLHLDFKSDNVMLRQVQADAGEAGPAEAAVEAVIMDFGLSRQRDAVLRASQYLRGIGTVQYMALEQLEGHKNLTPAVDIYAFGVVLFEMLTGRLPFLENSLGAMLRCHQRERAPLVSELRPEVHPALAAYVARCLHRSAERRFPDAGAALAAFDALPSWTTSPLRQRTRTIAVVAAGTLGSIAALVALSGALHGPSSPEAAIGRSETQIGQLQIDTTPEQAREPSPSSTAPDHEPTAQAPAGSTSEVSPPAPTLAPVSSPIPVSAPTPAPEAAPEPPERAPSQRTKRPSRSTLFVAEAPLDQEAPASKSAEPPPARKLRHVPSPLPLQLGDPAEPPPRSAGPGTAASVTVAHAAESASARTPPAPPADTE